MSAKDNLLFVELKNKPEAKWVCDLIEQWEKNGEDSELGIKFDEQKPASQYWLEIYLEHCDRIEDLVYSSWKQYCEKK